MKGLATFRIRTKLMVGSVCALVVLVAVLSYALSVGGRASASLSTIVAEDLQLINASSDDASELKKNVHKLHGAVRYCGVPRLARAIEKLESALKQNDEEQIPFLLNLLNGEITALESWYRNNPDPFGQRSVAG